MLKPLVVSISLVILLVLLLFLFCADCFIFNHGAPEDGNNTKIEGKSPLSITIGQYAPKFNGRCGQRSDAVYSSRIVGGHKATIAHFP